MTTSPTPPVQAMTVAPPDFLSMAEKAGLLKGPGGSYRKWLTPREIGMMTAAYAAARQTWEAERAAERRCDACKAATDLCCADCRIDLGASVYVCARPECRDAHERKCPSVLAKRCDAEMERVKACEHIAEGTEGWEVLRNLCPSTVAVAALRDERAALLRRIADLERQAKDDTRDASAEQGWKDRQGDDYGSY